jgi:hypothetical protein
MELTGKSHVSLDPDEAESDQSDTEGESREDPEDSDKDSHKNIR